MTIPLLITIIAVLFVVVALAEPLAGRLRLPFSVILALIGMAIGLGAVFFLQTNLTDALNPVASVILNLPIRSNIFLSVFLPTLLFQVTLGANVRRMVDDWVPILVLAIVAVVVATFFVGYALAWTTALPFAACLLVGAIVSTTDPSAVVAIFRSIAAPRRLARIIEGESLLNDAAAIALFSLFITFVMSGAAEPSFGEAFAQFPYLVVGGAASGWLLARLVIGVMPALRQYETAQITLSIPLPYLAYIFADTVLGASGVIAVVAAGLTLNLAGPGQVAPSAWSNLRETWDLLAHWAGALIFVLAAVLIPRLLEGVELADLLMIATVILAATLARFVVLFGLLPLLSAARLSPRVGRPYRAAILWGGLRGAVTLALALAVTESLRVPEDIRRTVGILATGFTLFTLLIQGSTLRWVIGLLGLDKLSPLDVALYNQVVAVGLQSVREDLKKATSNYELSPEIVRSEAKRFGTRLNGAVQAAEASREILDRDRITLGLLALASAERDAVLERFRERAVSARLSDRVLSNADRLIEATRQDGRMGYQRAARRILSVGFDTRVAMFLHNHLSISRPLMKLTADRFEILISQRLILKHLHGFVNQRVRRIHGKRVADLLHDLMARRDAAVVQALDGLQLQYPGYVQELERRFIQRTAIRLEEREYQALRSEGLISAEVHTSLMHAIALRRRRTERRPTLDRAIEKGDLVRQFPLFSDLDEDEVRRLIRVLRTLRVSSGDVIVKRGNPADTVYFIATGAVEIAMAKQTYRLGRGEMFGQFAALRRVPRTAEVRAITSGTLMLLDEDRFRRLLERSDALHRAVAEGAERLGIDMEDLLKASRETDAAESR